MFDSFASHCLGYGDGLGRERGLGGAELTELLELVGATAVDHSVGGEKVGVVARRGYVHTLVGLELVDELRRDERRLARVSESAAGAEAAREHLAALGAERRVEFAHDHLDDAHVVLLEVVVHLRHGLLHVVAVAQIEVGIRAPAEHVEIVIVVVVIIHIFTRSELLPLVDGEMFQGCEPVVVFPG